MILWRIHYGDDGLPEKMYAVYGRRDEIGRCKRCPKKFVTRGGTKYQCNRASWHKGGCEFEGQGDEEAVANALLEFE